MKKYLATMATVVILVFAFGLAPAGAQDQPPVPYNTQQPPPPYNNGPYNNGPYNNGQGAPPSYNNPGAPPPYNNQGAQGAPDQSTNGTTDGSQPGEARVSIVQGDVSSQRGDNGDWVALTQNAPISPGDRVATGNNSRTELQLDAADVLRMSSNTTANIVTLNRNGLQVQIGQGLANFTVIRGSDANPEIDTPNVAIHPTGAGEFRIQVTSDAETKITIRSGSADISTPQGSTHVEAGQMITVQGTDNPQYRTDAAPNADAFDTWNDERDRHIVSAQSWHKTDPYYTGSEDLDTYGVWSEVPDYGPVWTPSNPDPNWAPYRAGRWVWTPYYGWTWVSSEPWGWAPYHYGRWFIYGGRWSWWPGPVVAYPAYYPVWAPAYVSFFGWGGGGFGFGVGFGFGFGSVGWFPIGPCDWFHPWWGGWGRGYRTFGVANINGFHQGFGPLAGERGFGGRRFSNVDGIMHDGRLQGGISSMSSHDFGRGAVSGSQQRFNESSLRQASMVSGRMPISPSRESFSPSGRAANPSSLRSVPSSSQHFFSSNSQRGGNNSFNGNRGFTGANSAGVNNNNTGSRPGSFERPGEGAVTNRGSTGNAGGNFNRSGQGFGGTSTTPQSETRGWQHFTPSSRGSESQGFYNRGSSTQGQNHSSFEPPSSASRGGTSNSYSRPPLNMRQPIVTPRSGSTYGNGGGYNPPRSNPYNAPRGNYSQPHNTYGGQAAPRSNSSGGGSHSGGHSGGGGGGHHH
jgi:hypothetical protein